jgi:hypothetical protein
MRWRAKQNHDFAAIPGRLESGFHTSRIAPTAQARIQHGEPNGGGTEIDLLSEVIAVPDDPCQPIGRPVGMIVCARQ